MASTLSPSRAERPPGLAVWAGLDPFGAEVVARLSRWLGDDPAGRELAAANRLLPNLTLAGPAPEPGADIHASRGMTPARSVAQAAPPAVAYDPATEAIQQALGELLADQPSRAALAWADRDLLVPHIWLVADLAAPEVAGLAPWLAGLHQRLDALQVEARVYLLLRNRSWGRPATEQAEVTRRIQALVEEVCAAGKPGAGHTLAFVVSDRDGIGGRYTDADTTALAQRFSDLVLLGDVPHGNDTGAAEAFVAPVDVGDSHWDRLPVFASVAGTTLRWDAPALFRDNAERRRHRLFAALEEPVAPSFDPPYPVLHRVDLATGARWPALDLPRWSPRFWRSDRQEYARAHDALERWLVQAGRWRHEMLVVHEDRRAHVEHRADGAIRQYVEEIDSLTRSLLDDGSVPGFFAPLRRLHERSAADLRVRRADLRSRPGREAPPVPDGDPFDAAAFLTDPAAAMAGADDRLVAKLERKINPYLFAGVAVTVFLVAWAWTVVLARLITRWRPEPATNAQTGGDGGSIINRISTWLTSDVLPLLQGIIPSEPQVMLWSALLLGLPLLAICVIIALRQRVVLERAWKVVHDRARRWRDTSAAALMDDLARVELALARRNLDTATAEIEGRATRLEALRQLGAEPADRPVPHDPVISDHIVPATAPPPPLTEVQVAQIVGNFRRGRHDDPALRDSAERLTEALYVAAARVAGDPEPDLRLELPVLRRRIVAAMPPAGAIRVQQLDTAAPAEAAPPPVVRFFAAPARVAADLAASEVPVIALPVADRFYAVVVQSGMSARRVLSLPAALPASPPRPDPASATDDVGRKLGPVTADPFAVAVADGFNGRSHGGGDLSSPDSAHDGPPVPSAEPDRADVVLAHQAALRVDPERWPGPPVPPERETPPSAAGDD